MTDMTAASLEPRIIGTRAAFIDAFDAFAASIPGAPKFRVVAQLRQRTPGEDPDRADIVAALKEAEAQGFLTNMVRITGETLFKSTQDAATAIPVLAAEDSATRDSLKATYQAIVTNQAAGTSNEVSDGLAKAQRRTCKITVRLASGNVETGTGFLIGPRLVLTCWHVIRSLLSSRDAAAPTRDVGWTPTGDARKRVKVEFDFVARAGQGRQACGLSADWLVYASAADGSEHQFYPAGQWPLGANLETYTDFAVLELDQSPGLDRGYYNLRDIDVEPSEPTGMMVIFHHPGQLSMRVSPGQFEETPAVAAQFGAIGNSPARRLHTANTIGGSSGGLCLDFSMRAVALHQAGLEARASTAVDDEGNPVSQARINVAIPLRVVRKKAGAAIAKRIGSFTAARTVLATGQAVIGRFKLQELISQARDGYRKLLVITTNFDTNGNLLPQIGKSFSTQILKDVLADTGHLVLEYKAAELTGTAQEIAQVLLGKISATAAAQVTGAASSDAQSTQLVDQIVPLVNGVAAKMNELAGNQTVWLVIDELDKLDDKQHRLDAATAIFLEQLFPAIAAQKSLRLVLIGLKDRNPAALLAVSAKETEVILPIDRAILSQWLAMRLSNFQVLDDPAKDSLAGIVCKLAERRRSNGQESQSASIAHVVNDLVEPEMPKLDGLP